MIPLENGYVWLKLVVVVNKASKGTPSYIFLNNIRFKLFLDTVYKNK